MEFDCWLALSSVGCICRLFFHCFDFLSFLCVFSFLFVSFPGTEVKPGKPFTQKFDDFKGRLHVSLVMITNSTLCSL